MTPEQAQNAADWITDAVSKKDNTYLMGSIAHSLLRIANAQEAIHELAVQDLNESIEAAIESRAQEKADQMEADRASRGFIGKR